MQYASTHANHVSFEGDRKVSVKSTGLDSKLRRVLKQRMKIKDLFDMQGKVFSHVQSLDETCRSGDIVLRAPTGSGKTLAYALPITHALIRRIVPRLRVIVVVPTRDLANQVAKVFETLTGDTGIGVEVAVGASSIACESRAVCKAEVLVATPGRLVYHVENTESFVLSHVRYLVLDESDRLLEESYQDWINKLLPLLGSFSDARSTVDGDNRVQRPLLGMFAVAMVPHITARNSSMYSGVSQECVRKFLVSATQTTNPMRLHDLDLRDPTFFQPSVTNDDENTKASNGETGRCTVPPNMIERGWVVKDLPEKPAGLLVLLGWVKAVSGEMSRKNDQGHSLFGRSGAKLVFTHSVESAHRLCRLLELCAFALRQKGEVLEMSGELSTERRNFVVSKIKELSDTPLGHGTESDRFLVVVCSDVLARGMDMVNVDTIINYDAPVHINKYLHRAGRTARAGRPGVVYTLMLEKQAHHFREMVREADRGDKKVITKNLTVRFPEKSTLPRVISAGLASLRRVLKREGLGLLHAGDSLPQHALYELCSHSHLDQSRREHEIGPENYELASFLQDSNNTHPRKRRRELQQEDERHDRHHDLTNDEDVADDNYEESEDTFEDLIFSQVARGLSMKPSAG